MGEFGGIVIADHEVPPDLDNLLQRAGHVGVMVAGDDGDTVGCAELHQPLARPDELLTQGEIDEISGHYDMVGPLSVNILDQGGEDVIVEAVAAVALPVDVTEQPFRYEVAPSDGRQGPEMQIGQVGEGEHCRRLIRRAGRRKEVPVLAGQLQQANLRR